MDTVLTTTQYPLVPFTHKVALSEYQSDFLKNAFTDFHITVYSNKIAGPVLGYLTGINSSGNSLKISFNFKAKLTDTDSLQSVCDLVLDFDSAFALSESSFNGSVRVHFDSADCVNLDSANVSAVDGYACFVGLTRWNTVFNNLDLKESKILLEPTCITVVGNHRVESFKCQYAKPLIVQAANPDESPYYPVSAPVSGNVNFVGGNNCLITLQESSNTVLISAIRNANGTDQEVCGVWAEAISDADVLCSEATYSLAGAYPDDNGNILITGQYPLSVSTRPKESLPDPIAAFVETPYKHIKTFIYVGAIARGLEAVCDPPIPEICPN